MQTLRRLMTNESGATAIEYGLIAALISVVAIVALRSVGNGLQRTFNNVAGQLNGSSK